VTEIYEWLKAAQKLENEVAKETKKALRRK